MNADQIINDLFTTFEDVRYVAIYKNGHLLFQQKEHTDDSSTGGTDRFEELLVNPTVLTLAKQRGNIDCGGLRFFIIGYGNFYQLVKEIRNGHISICLKKESNITQLPEELFHYVGEKYPELELLTDP